MSERLPRFKHPKVKCAMMKGPSGKIGYPAYIEDWHSDLIGTLAGAGATAVANLLATLHSGSSPYNSTNATDASAEFDPVKTRYTTYDTLVAALVASTDWNSFLTQAQGKADDASLFPVINLQERLKSDAITDVVTEATNVAASAAIDNIINAEEALAANRVSRAFNKMSGLMAENGALHTGWIMGLAMIQSDLTTEITHNEHQLRHDLFRFVLDRGAAATYEAAMRRQALRDSIVVDGANNLLQTKRSDAQISGQSVASRTEIARMSYTAEKEENDENMRRDVEDALWDMHASGLAAAILGAPGGAQPIPSSNSKLQGALGGAFSGAATGAMIGSAVPGIGNVAGAGIGFLAGGLAGFFG